MSMNKDDFFKLVEKLNEVNKSLESSFKYQVITILGFFLILNDTGGDIEFVGLKIHRDAFITIFPVMLLYFLSRACILTTLFIELYERFYTELGNEKLELRNELLTFRVPTIFLCIPLTKFPKGRNKINYFLHYVLSSIVYSLTGISLGLIIYYFYYLFVFNKMYISLLFFLILLIPICILYYEYVKGRVTRNYKYLIHVAISVALIVVLVIHMNRPKLYERSIKTKEVKTSVIQFD